MPSDVGEGAGLRYRIDLECADGSSNRGVAARLGITPATIGKWCRATSIIVAREVEQRRLVFVGGSSLLRKAPLQPAVHEDHEDHHGGRARYPLQSSQYSRTNVPGQYSWYRTLNA